MIALYGKEQIFNIKIINRKTKIPLKVIFVLNGSIK
jgi:hypothetical protein